MVISHSTTPDSFALAVARSRKTSVQPKPYHILYLTQMKASPRTVASTRITTSAPTGIPTAKPRGTPSPELGGGAMVSRGGIGGRGELSLMGPEMGNGSVGDSTDNTSVRCACM